MVLTKEQKKQLSIMNKMYIGIGILFILVFLSISGQATAEYGDGWQRICDDSNNCAYSNHHTILRWDNQYIPIEWLNINNGNWTYQYSQNATYHNLYRLGEWLSLHKSFANYTFDLNKISLEFTVNKTKLAERSINDTANCGFNCWYIVIPDKAAKTRFMWDNKLPVISNESGMILNQSEYDTNGALKWENYKYKVVGDEIRLYYNQTARNFGLASALITFKFDSWIVGTGGNAWSGNSTLINTTLNRDTNNIELRQNVDDYISYWRFDGSSGITAYDENQTSNNNGTWYGNTTANWTTGQYGNALQFDGVNDYVNAGNAASLNITSAITVTAWFKLNALSGYNSIVVKDISSTVIPYFLRIYNGFPRFDTYHDSITYSSGVAPIVSTDTWYFVTGTFDSSLPSDNLKIYVNGILKSSGSHTSPLPSNTANVKVGYYGSDYINGTIDEVRIYNRALTNDEINLTMNQSKYYSGYIKTWHDAGIDNETYQVSSNGTFAANSNQSGQYAQNGSTPTGYLNPENQTVNYTWATVPSYQNTDWYTWLFGNGTATPQISTITMWTQEINPLNLTECGTLDIDGGQYVLQNNVSSDGTCFVINANNITFNGQGYIIKYGEIDDDWYYGFKQWQELYNITLYNFTIINTYYNGSGMDFTYGLNASLLHDINIIGTNYGWYGKINNTILKNFSFENNSNVGCQIASVFNSYIQNFSVSCSSENCFGASLEVSDIGAYNTFIDIFINGSNNPLSTGIWTAIEDTNFYNITSKDNHVDYYVGAYPLFEVGSGKNTTFYNINLSQNTSIQFYNSSYFFNFSNSNIKMDTNVSNTSEEANIIVYRKINAWSQEYSSWNDYTVQLVYYSISGLLSNTYYKVYNNSVNSYSLTTDASGNLPEFSIDLNGETEIQVIQYVIDTSFSISIPIDQIQMNFTPSNSTVKYFYPNGQNLTVPFFVVTNEGNINQSFRFYLDDVIANIDLFTDLDSSHSDGTTLINTTTSIIIINDLGINTSQNVWTFANFSHTIPQNTNRILSINSSS